MVDRETPKTGSDAVLIGDAAAVTGLSRKTIRYYEREGLLQEIPRNRSGYRVFGDEHLSRLRFIVRAREAGLAIDAIRSILRTHKTLGRTCDVTRGLLRQELADTRDRIEKLRRQEEQLQALLAIPSVPGDDSSNRSVCPLIERGIQPG